MEGMWFTRNRQNTRSFGKILAGNPTRPPTPVTCADIVVLGSPPIPFPDLKRVLFEIEIPCVLLFLNQNKNSQNSPKIMHPSLERSNNDDASLRQRRAHKVENAMASLTRLHENMFKTDLWP